MVNSRCLWQHFRLAAVTVMFYYSITMNTVTAVTGPPRSGTSLVTGLLESCGMNLGTAFRVLRESSPLNPRGHLETDMMITINGRILFESFKNPFIASSNTEFIPENSDILFNIPSDRCIQRTAAKRKAYFLKFTEKFDGNLLKDPMLCLTLKYWESYWPELKQTIFCLRNPLSVAISMNSRYGISLEEGMEKWEDYTRRFFFNERKTNFYIFDYDAFLSNRTDVFMKLLNWLSIEMSVPDLNEIIQGYYIDKTSDRIGKSPSSISIEMPESMKIIYEDLKKGNIQ